MDKSSIIFLIILLCFLFIFIACPIISLYDKIKQFMKDIQDLKAITKAGEENKKPDLQVRYQNTANIISFVSSLVIDEVEYSLKTYRVTNTKYQILKLDEDITRISTKVFHSIDISIFNTDEILITPDYLMEIIIEECYVYMMKTVRELNATIRTDN